MDDTELAAIQRAVVQRLEDFQRAGLTHWKRIVPIAPEPVPQVATPPVSVAPLSKPVRPIDAHPPAHANPQPQVPDMPPKKAAPVAAVASVSTPFQPLNLPLAERVSRLKVLCDQVKGCTRCQELAETRTQTVFGVGNPEARIMFIGEAPGADEDKQGEPFVGRAGQLLNDIIKACRMKREDIYICNVLRCRPPGNRLPSPEEAHNCREYLDGQIAIVNPEYIVCWGSTAAKNLLASELPIGKMRGKFFEYGRAKVVCTYHPSYLLRNPAAKKDVWDDMKFLFQEMGIDLSAK
jgi:uracil-DNA glycosylase family 4